MPLAKFGVSDKKLGRLGGYTSGYSGYTKILQHEQGEAGQALSQVYFKTSISIYGFCCGNGNGCTYLF